LRYFWAIISKPLRVVDGKCVRNTYINRTKNFASNKFPIK
jgi:hypothetical protein